MPRLVEPPKYPKTIEGYGYKSSALPRFGGSGGLNRLKGIPSFGYASPNLTYKVGSGGKRPSALPPTMTPTGSASFTGGPGPRGNYALEQQSYDVGGGAKTQSTGDLVKNAALLGVGGTTIGSALALAGLPTLGLPTWGGLFSSGATAATAAPTATSGIASLWDSAKNTWTNATDWVGDKFNSVKNWWTGKEAPPEYSGISGFFNQPRSWIPGVSGTGADATGFLGGGQPGQGITSVGNVLGTIGGLYSLADFIDDPSLASGLGTLAGAGASGIGAFSGLATAAPWLAGAALVASLLMNKRPSNKTGYTSIDLDEFKPLSFGMQGKKYSQENVDQTMQIMEPIIPLIQQLEQHYGVDLKGDIQINYGGRDGLAYNIGNRDVTGYLNRLDYWGGSDRSIRDGGSIFRKTFKGENAGKDFYKSLLGDLEQLAIMKQSQGGGIIDLANYKGIQRQAPQGTLNYGFPGNVTANTTGGNTVTTAPRPSTGPQGIFTWGYDNAGT